MPRSCTSAAPRAARRERDVIRTARLAGVRTTPAMAAGVTKRFWEMSDVVGVLEAWEATQ
jgi:hypothetical protein